MKKTKEIWKDIEGFPNYEVSNLGRVRNKNTKQIIAPIKGSSGYLSVRIRKQTGDYEKPALNIHRLVAKTFIPNPENKPQVNHIDGNKLNNKMDNLEWCTRKENSKHAMKLGLFKPEPPEPPKKKVKIIETGEVFNSIRDCANSLGVAEQHIWACLNGIRKTRNGLHFEYINDKNKEQKSFLYPFQMDAVNRMFNGCILNGGTGSGKSRTGLYYYFKQQGGSFDPDYKPMRVKPRPKDLYIITTAKKKNTCEWQGELSHFLLSADEKQTKRYGNKIVIDSWNRIKNYVDVKDAFFIFDEDKVQGWGAWVKAFLKISKSNEWIILSATSGDQWVDYIPVFIASGFYKNRTEFAREHIIYSRFTKYPKIERYINTGKLLRLRNHILIDMDFKRKTMPHDEDIYVKYNITKYKDVTRTRWDPYKDEPIQQASNLCYILRRVVNEDESRQIALLELYEKHPKMIVFYNFDYELNILLNLHYGNNVKIAQYNGHVHDSLPEGDKWIYLVNYNACEGWNAITTDTIVFYSQTYSYKTLVQAKGRIDRLTTPFTDLYYYHLKSRSGIDLAISKALKEKKNFNETRWAKW